MPTRLRPPTRLGITHADVTVNGQKGAARSVGGSGNETVEPSSRRQKLRHSFMDTHNLCRRLGTPERDSDGDRKRHKLVGVGG